MFSYFSGELLTALRDQSKELPCHALGQSLQLISLAFTLDQIHKHIAVVLINTHRLAVASGGVGIQAVLEFAGLVHCNRRQAAANAAGHSGLRDRRTVA